MKCSYSRTKTYGGCCRPATVTREGKPFCWQHDPERRAARAAADKAERAAAEAKIEAEHDFRVRMIRAGLVHVTPDQLAEVERLGGLAAMIESLRQ